MVQYWLAQAAFLAGDAIRTAELPIAGEPEQLHMLTDAKVRACRGLHACLLLHA